MFDPNKLESPLHHVIDSITPDVNGIILTKDTTRVISLSPTAPYYNTRATIYDYDSETGGASNTRDINYNRIDIDEYIRDRAKINTMLDGTSEYVLVTNDVDRIVRQAGPTLVASVLKNNYGLPINLDDLTTVKSLPPHKTSSSFGEIYMLSNGVITGNTLTYISGLTVVHNLPDTTRYSYNKVRTNRRGMSFYREWANDTSIVITMPIASEADGWSLQIEDVNSIGHVGNGDLWLGASFNVNSGSWEYIADGNLRSLGAKDGGRIKIDIHENGITISGQSLSESSEYVTLHTDEVAATGEEYGLNRYTMYSNNPLAGTVNFGMNITDGANAPSDSDNKHLKQLSTIAAAESSNALFGKVKYPIMITRFDNEGFTQPTPAATFVGNDSKGYLSSVDKFSADMVQALSFNIDGFNTSIINNDVECFMVTVLNKDNVNFIYQIVCKPIVVDSVVQSIEVITKHNGETVFTSNKEIVEGDANIYVEIAPYHIGIAKDNVPVAALQTNIFDEIIDTNSQQQCLVRLDVVMQNNALLPTMHVNKTYDSIYQE